MTGRDALRCLDFGLLSSNASSSSEFALFRLLDSPCSFKGNLSPSLLKGFFKFFVGRRLTIGDTAGDLTIGETAGDLTIGEGEGDLVIGEGALRRSSSLIASNSVLLLLYLRKWSTGTVRTGRDDLLPVRGLGVISSTASSSSELVLLRLLLLRLSSTNAILP